MILKEGSDEARPNPYDEVCIHYVGTLPDGTEFDNSRSRNEKFVFKLDDGESTESLLLVYDFIMNMFVTAICQAWLLLQEGL